MKENFTSLLFVGVAVSIAFAFGQDHQAHHAPIDKVSPVHEQSKAAQPGRQPKQDSQAQSVPPQQTDKAEKHLTRGNQPYEPPQQYEDPQNKPVHFQQHRQGQNVGPESRHNSYSKTVPQRQGFDKHHVPPHENHHQHNQVTSNQGQNHQREDKVGDSQGQTPPRVQPIPVHSPPLESLGQHKTSTQLKEEAPEHPKIHVKLRTGSVSKQTEQGQDESSAMDAQSLKQESDAIVSDSLDEKSYVPQEPVTPPILVQAESTESMKEPVLTPEQIEAEQLYQEGEKLINATYYKEYKTAYLNFLKASELQHDKASEYVAFGYLFGDYLPQNVTKAHQMFDFLAAKGSPRAQMGLAFMFSSGFHFNSSQAKSLIYSTFGALGGDPLAQMMLGYRYYAGIGVESKCETALTYYRKVSAKVADGVTLAGGPVVQRVRLQEEAESQGTNNSPLLDEDLLQYYHFLADKGDQQAQVVLGTLYYQGGKGVQINHENAYHYFSTAAESGSGHAMGYLGKMHSEGSPVVTQSNYTALEYFKKSADKNNHIGQAGLGMMYLNGLGVERDTSKAFRYFSMASDQGSVDGQLQLGIMYFSGNGVRRDYKMAVKYFTMASQSGHILAFYNLAQMHATGTGVLRNCHTAVELFKNVAERGRWSEMLMDAHRMYHDGSIDTALVKYMFLAELGYEVAQSNVAFLLDNSISSHFNNFETHQRALLQYSRAASQGSTYARLKMGDYHYYGMGTAVDFESAASHYRVASEQQHNAQAMFNLGYMHEKGLGLKQDVHLAKRFYDMAAESSTDAHVPVTLALFKLGLLYGMEVFNKEFQGIKSLKEWLHPNNLFGPSWDIYLATVFAVAFGILLFLRRR